MKDKAIGVALVGVVLVALAACNGTIESIRPVDAGGEACDKDAECTGGAVCVFARADGCGAKGACKDPGGIGTCAAYSPGCACDGTEINVVCQPFDGYVSRPFAHDGACGDAGL